MTRLGSTELEVREVLMRGPAWMQPCEVARAIYGAGATRSQKSAVSRACRRLAEKGHAMQLEGGGWYSCAPEGATRAQLERIVEAVMASNSSLGGRRGD